MVFNATFNKNNKYNLFKTVTRKLNTIFGPVKNEAHIYMYAMSLWWFVNINRHTQPLDVSFGEIKPNSRDTNLRVKKRSI